MKYRFEVEALIGFKVEAETKKEAYLLAEAIVDGLINWDDGYKLPYDAWLTIPENGLTLVEEATDG